jgi:hypothetical protein
MTLANETNVPIPGRPVRLRREVSPAELIESRRNQFHDNGS